MGCVSRAFDPHSRITSASSISRYELVPPPAPKTAARPATLGACQVRLQLSMLLLPMTTLANFCARKFSSFVAFEQLKIPKACGPCFSTERRKPCVVRSRASSQVAGRRFPLSRTMGIVSRLPLALTIYSPPFQPKHLPDFLSARAQLPYFRVGHDL